MPWPAIRLDQLVEAADALEAALRFGRVPFTADLYAQALDYDHLIRGRVGTIAAECSQHGVRVWLDGKRWFTCPGTNRVRVLAGEHVLVADRRGSMTLSRQVFVTGAGTSRHTIELAPVEMHARYPTARWIPWTVAGAGAAVALAGLGTWFVGRNDAERFEARYAIECVNRCSEELAEHPDLRDLRSRAQLEGDVGIGLMVAGGAVAVGGLVWATLINRPDQLMLAVDVSRDGGATVHATWRLP